MSERNSNVYAAELLRTRTVRSTRFCTAPPIPRRFPSSHRPQPRQVRTAPLASASASTLTSLPRAVGSAWVEAQRCLAACDSLGGGGGGGAGRDREAAPSGSTAHRTPLDAQRELPEPLAPREIG